MTLVDVYSGKVLCSHPDCHWTVEEGGWSGVEARYRDEEGNPACWDHRKDD